MLIKKLPKNEEGRDFVCGDIHGSYSCVERFLKEINFDKSKDRFICAGDLIDRGPDNLKCLELLLEPWFFMTKGNHEDMMQQFFADTELGTWWFPNGGMWAASLVNNHSDDGELVRQAAQELIPNLPLLITVEKANGGKFHVLHAEVYPGRGQQLSDEIFADEDAFADLAFSHSHDGEAVMWGRYYFMHMYKSDLSSGKATKSAYRGAKLDKKDTFFGPQISPIYSGHTPVQRPVQFFGQTNLDTMAYASYTDRRDYRSWAGLTVTEPATGKFWLVNDQEFKEVLPVVINDEMFGSTKE